MKFSTLSPLVLLAAIACSVSAAPAADVTEDAAITELDELHATANDNLLAALDAEEAALSKRGLTASCTSKTIVRRKEFGALTKAERKSYTDAVLCLQSKSPKTPSALVPGARSRFDDFIGTHINQTLTIHYTGTFLGWHRWFTFIYEKALREECGYTGYQPYWDWPLYADAPQDSPIFNGDAYSMSGNGVFSPHNGTIIGGTPGLTTIQLAAGLGGGCVTTGPFKNMSVNLGPVSLDGAATGPNGGLGYNPRCLKRDVGPGVAKKYTNATAVSTLICDNNNIADFQLVMQGVPGSGTIGVHGGGHYTINGDPGGDLFTSPGDPAFYLHHGQIDRVWATWQNLDIANREKAIAGTGTFLDSPASANITLDTPIDVGYAGGGVVKMADLMSTTKGPFCYMYV